MKKPTDEFLAERSALPLPKTAKTRSGVEFSLNTTRWSFRDGTRSLSFNFTLLTDSFTPLLPGLQKTLLWYIENRAATSARTAFVAFIWLARKISNINNAMHERITPEQILFIRTISEKSDKPFYFLRSFFRKWSELRAKGVGQDVVD